jgi:hypothetical protein
MTHTPVTAHATCLGAVGGCGVRTVDADRLPSSVTRFECTHPHTPLEGLFVDTCALWVRVQCFQDPLTQYDGIQGYLFNIQFLRRVFTPWFVLHSVTETKPCELTTRWTMGMKMGWVPFAALWTPVRALLALSTPPRGATTKQTC